MNIGEAARVSGVSAKLVRYDESIGLIPQAGRTEAGYRTYVDREVKTLRFIRRARDFGLPMDRVTLLVQTEPAVDQKQSVSEPSNPSVRNRQKDAKKNGMPHPPLHPSNPNRTAYNAISAIWQPGDMPDEVDAAVVVLLRYLRKRETEDG